MTKKTVQKKGSSRGTKVDLNTFVATTDASAGSSWADEMEETAPSVPTPSSGLTLDELREKSSEGGFHRGGGYGGYNRESGFSSSRESQYSREISNNSTGRVKPSSFFSEGAPQKQSESSFGGERRRGGDRERPQQQHNNEMPTEKPFVCFVGNLSYETSKNELEDFFGECSPINISLPRDRENDRLKGYGYVEFDTAQDMKAALAMSGQNFNGRSIKVDITSPETAAKVTIDNRDSAFGRRGPRRETKDFDDSQRYAPSVADKSDNWRSGRGADDFGDVNPFGGKKKEGVERRDNGRGFADSSKPFGSSFKPATKREEKPKSSPFGEGKPWEPKEKDLEKPNLEFFSSKKVEED